MPLRSPRHDRAAAYARSGLFKELRSFAELERRIEQLPTEKERGDAFEVFVEAYLSTDEVAQAEEVWVVGKVPGEVRRRLNLPSSDYGYDGVFRTKLDELVPYQAKFRSGRTSLPYAELATFFGISEKADRRVVLTNSIAISAVAESRTSFQTTRGGDFDRLDAAQLAAIAAWVEGIAPLPFVRQPRPHQRAALADIEKELSARDRATVVMACGTGKTLVALWAAESAQPKRVLVLVPSLNLLRQTLHEWARWTNWGERFRYLCVCSDPKVAKGIDEIEIRPEDADFPVMTDPGIVKRFLDQRDDAVSVVFCTYQSAPVVGEAMKGRQPFDLGIFDEAHKTTGREGTRYAFALKDKNLPIRKRLFLTATPRHYDVRKRDKEGDFAVTSMDDEATYGRVAHRLTFAEAAEQRIIVPYKVVISVVDSEMIDNALMDRGEVSIKGDPVRAKWVAHQIALKRAVEEHDLKRLITFHSSIRAAAAFVSDDSEGIGIHLPNFQRFHVSGVQPTAERDEHMQEFARVQRGVITNARCLTEGVDVPSVDLVAFMNPRRSRVDIVQAVGRAMRTAGEEKTCGYVLVPLFLEMRKGETLDEALERSDFDEIAQVLNAMRENDDELSDIIQELSVDQGRVGGFDESRLRDKFEVLGPQIQLSELAASIRAMLVEELGITWDMRYGELLAYKEKHGDCNVPQRWNDNPELGVWCATQRFAYKNNEMFAERVSRLEQLGFVWDTLEAAWEEMFAALTAYKQAHGDCNPPRFWKVEPNLGPWCRIQRKSFKKDKLSPDRTKRLEKLGFVWDPLEVAWEEKFAELSAYRKTHGDWVGWKDNPELAEWCDRQRRYYKNHKLPAHRVKRLEQLGFVWENKLDIAWEAMFAALTAYKQTHGDCNVPQGWKDNPQLARWCATQRTRYKKKKMPADHIERLEKLGFKWFPYAVDWEEMFAALTTYKQDRGDCNVPHRWKENPSLGGWCQTQRFVYKKNKLSSDRVKRLEQLGFVWDPLVVAWEESWEEKFGALTAYKQIHGDCNVPAQSKDDLKLGSWCSHQRILYKNGKLSADYVKRLEQLGFEWDPHEVAWEEMFVALTSYKQTHGDCNVPDRWKDNPKLASWCANQRHYQKQNKLPPDRTRRLSQLGIVWEQFETAWEEMIAALTAYKQAHGDCNVPQRWKNNPKLGSWCITQRTLYRENKLSPNRVTHLEQLGFEWDPLAAAWGEMFAELTDYKKAHGDCNVPAVWKDNPKLGMWCNTQRTLYRKNKLPPNRVARLEQLGFEWEPYTVLWEEMFAALIAYKQAHGDCNVPQGWKDNSRLGGWCGTQRAAYKKNKLSPDRIKRLKDLGFRFVLRESKKKSDKS